jgi:hypothetical protein
MRRASIFNTSALRAGLCTVTVALTLAAGTDTAVAAAVFGEPVPGAAGEAPATTTPAKGASSKHTPHAGRPTAGAPKTGAAKAATSKIKASKAIKLPANLPLAPSAATSSSSNTGTLMILALVSAAALLCGIAYMILRDARTVAPVGDGPVGGGSAGSSAARLRKRRAKAKAARRQRKRNR